MKCFKCQKEMDREDGEDTIKGIEVIVTKAHRSIINTDICSNRESVFTQTPIEYNNLQLGKYSNGSGECDVAICYECYIDGLFHIGVT